MRDLSVEPRRVDEHVADVHAVVRREEALLCRHRDFDAVSVRAADRHLAQFFFRRDTLDRFLILHARRLFTLQRRPAIRFVGPPLAQILEIVVDDGQHDLPRIVEIVGELSDARQRAKIGGHLVDSRVGRRGYHRDDHLGGALHDGAAGRIGVTAETVPARGVVGTGDGIHIRSGASSVGGFGKPRRHERRRDRAKRSGAAECGNAAGQFSG